MGFGLCGFLIIKPQTALHHALWCSAVQDYLRCGAVMPFCRQFWCSFYGLCGLCGLVNTPNHKSSSLTEASVWYKSCQKHRNYKDGMIECSIGDSFLLWWFTATLSRSVQSQKTKNTKVQVLKANQVEYLLLD